VPAAPSLPDAFYRALLDGVSEGVYFVDRDRRILYWNRGAELISGFAADEIVGHSCRDGFLVHCDAGGVQLCGDRCPLVETMNDGSGRTAEVFLRHKQGFRLPVLVRSSAVRDPSGAIIGAVETFSDNSRTVAAIERANHCAELAHVDPLTGVCNRRSADDLIASLNNASHKTRGAVFLMIDVDDFKRVNDTYGHLAGDQVVRMVANTLRNNLRPYDFVCRWGGEEFLVILADASLREGLAIGERCRVLVAASSCETPNGRVTVTCSIGLSELRPGETAELALARADGMLLLSKKTGRNRVTVAENPA
jgi:diguanylate cyclase (GGDEF)-like protein/PAS domain S-box-containing protein